MIHQKKIVVVLPAYNASNTLLATYNDIPFDIVDDASSINFSRSVKYGMGVMKTSCQYFLSKTKIYKSRLFK